jgi:hypothetical protein
MTDNPDSGASFRAVVEAVSKALDAVVESTPPGQVVTGLVLAAAGIAVATGGSEEDFVEGCRRIYKFAVSGKDRAAV